MVKEAKKVRTNLKNKNILVVGGAGFIGSHLVDSLISAGVSSVAVIDNFFLGNILNLRSSIEKGIKVYRDDAEKFSTLQYIFNERKIDVVFNCATKALNYSFINPTEAFLTNVQVLSNLLELQREKKFETLCHFSTSEVYGTAVYEPMDENHPLNPTTSYAAGKAAADIMLQSFVRMFSLDAFIVRPFNNYGPRQNYSGALAAIMPLTFYKIYNDLNPEIHGTGRQSRDFIYVEDTVQSVLKLYEIMQPGESVNISSESQISMEDLMHLLCKTAGYSGEILRKPERVSDVLAHNASNQKLRSLIDFNPLSLREGIDKTYKFYMEEFTKNKQND